MLLALLSFPAAVPGFEAEHEVCGLLGRLLPVVATVELGVNKVSLFLVRYTENLLVCFGSDCLLPELLTELGCNSRVLD